MKIPVSKPDLSGNELKYVRDCIKSGWISSKGDYIKKFEEKFAKWSGMKYGIACSSGTNALFLALKALRIGRGDEVIVPEFTMIATAWTVSYTGARPIFVDCGEDLNINPEKIEEVITGRTKAIIPVHIYGRSCKMDKILELAHDYNLRIIEDSCEAIGIKPKGDIACFSLFANKVITAGEGGICLTNDKHLAEQMEHLRGMAFDKDHSFLHKKYAYNFRITNLQGAVALAQLERIEEILKIRKQIEEWYDEGLKDIKEIKILPKRDIVWYYDLLAFDRDELREFLAQNGIETRVFFKPMSLQPMYFDPKVMTLMAYKFSLEGLYLPTFNQLTKEEIDFISSKIREFYVTKQG